MSLKAGMELKLDDWATMPIMDDFLKYFARPVQVEVQEIEGEYNKIIRKFKSKKSKRVKLVRTKALLRAHPDSSYKRGKSVFAVFGTDFTRTPLVWLEWGTAWRARRMSYDWVSKTSPGSLTVGAGKGYARRGKNAWGRLPGIKARDWRHTIADKRMNTFAERCLWAFDAMLLNKNII